MNKAKNKPAAAKAAAAEAPRPVQNRARDLEDDVFDVAHNTMLRSKVVDHYSSHTSSRAGPSVATGARHAQLLLVARRARSALVPRDVVPMRQVGDGHGERDADGGRHGLQWRIAVTTWSVRLVVCVLSVPCPVGSPRL